MPAARARPALTSLAVALACVLLAGLPLDSQARLVDGRVPAAAWRRTRRPGLALARVAGDESVSDGQVRARRAAAAGPGRARPRLRVRGMPDQEAVEVEEVKEEEEEEASEGGGGNDGGAVADEPTATAAVWRALPPSPPPPSIHTSPSRPDCPPRLYTSPSSDRTFMATVLGLAAGAEVYGPNSTRLPDFMAAWTRAWPGLHIEHQPTFANHPDLRGYGVAAGYYVGLVRSMAYLRDRNATCDYHLMFEDDGLPFNGTTWPGTGDGSATPNDLDARLDALEAVHGAALALGGHRFVNVSRADAAQAAARPRGGIVSAGRADGAYALVIACAALPGVAAHLHAHLRQATSRFYFEQALWSALKGTGTGPYVSVPLLVDHAHGFSATWNRTVDRAFEGNATFW